MMTHQPANFLPRIISNTPQITKIILIIQILVNHITQIQARRPRQPSEASTQAKYRRGQQEDRPIRHLPNRRSFAYGVETVKDSDHYTIQLLLGQPTNSHTPITVESTTTKGAAIYQHNLHPSYKICLLNFTDCLKQGGGYLNCRQTVLYPTLQGSGMYSEPRQEDGQ